ncbi:hypothetical protein G9A89_014270 [Geosiphon pyriformis]|nr:hypothetical protein G9A89_014270 [Geosiphon pyriformis]
MQPLFTPSFILFSFLFSFSSSPTLISAIPSLTKRGEFKGEGTYYNPGMGACGQNSGASSFIAALNRPQWGNPPNPNANPICGKQAIVTGPKGTTTVTIVDLCPECAFGSLDLSPAAFNQIADPSAGRVPISWIFAGDAPAPSPSPPPPPPPPPTPKVTVTTSSQTSTTTTSTSTSSTTSTTSSTTTSSTSTSTSLSSSSHISTIKMPIKQLPQIAFAFFNGEPADILTASMTNGSNGSTVSSNTSEPTAHPDAKSPIRAESSPIVKISDLTSFQTPSS